MPAMVDFKNQLRRQLGFIERSAKLYDDGFADEAFRIAVSLRVLFHQTGASTSLMTHLGSPAVLIRSTVPDLSSMWSAIGGKKVVGTYFVSLATITVSPTGCAFLPKSNEADPHRMLPWQDWWNEEFASINAASYTRRGLVLWAVNKDGGAHVDATIPSEYEAIKASAALGRFQHNGQDIPIEDAHLVFLRSMAFEILSSPDFVGLATP